MLLIPTFDLDATNFAYNVTLLILHGIGKTRLGFKAIFFEPNERSKLAEPTDEMAIRGVSVVTEAIAIAFKSLLGEQ